MTPLQFAQAECANWMNGKCLNIEIRQSLMNTVGKPLDKCKLSDGRRCRYFEDCLMPMVRNKREDIIEAVESYRMQHFAVRHPKRYKDYKERLQNAQKTRCSTPRNDDREGGAI